LLLNNVHSLILTKAHFLPGGYELFSAFYPFLRTQKIIYMPRVRVEIIHRPIMNGKLVKTSMGCVSVSNETVVNIEKN